MPKAQVVKWGNSLAVRIPKAVAAEARMQEGDSILIEGSHGHIEIQRVPTLEELVAQITPENRHGEIEAGPELGKEIVEW